jgi:hypothetical protein
LLTFLLIFFAQFSRSGRRGTAALAQLNIPHPDDSATDDEDSDDEDRQAKEPQRDWQGMLHVHLARAVWRRGHSKRAWHHFKLAAERCQSDSEVLTGVGVFLSCCPVAVSAKGTPQLQPEEALRYLQKARSLGDGLGWVFSEVGEERLSVVMGQLDGDDGFAPPPAIPSEQVKRGLK